MRSPFDVLAGRVAGFKKMEIARRTVPCYKHVIEKEGEKLARHQRSRSQGALSAG